MLLKMKLSRIDYISIFLIILSFVAAFYLYDTVPEQLPTHWNAAGEVDAYSSRFTGLFLLPIMMAAIYLLFLIIPAISVYKKNIENYMKYFDYIKLTLTAFMLSLYAAMLVYIWKPFNMTYFVIPVMAVLFYIIGWAIGKAKRNYFIGIRTPWTLASEKVWDKTHKFGSILLRVSALLLLPALLLPPQILFIVFMVLILGSVLITVVYSYVEWKKEK